MIHIKFFHISNEKYNQILSKTLLRKMLEILLRNTSKNQIEPGKGIFDDLQHNTTRLQSIPNAKNNQLEIFVPDLAQNS